MLYACGVQLERYTFVRYRERGLHGHERQGDPPMNSPQSRSASRLLRRLVCCAWVAACATAAYADLLVGNFFSPELDVLRFSATGSFVGTFVTTGSGGLTFPLGGAFGPDGNFYVSDSDHENVLRYNGATGAFIDIFATTDDPAGLVFGPGGDLFVANSQAPGSVTQFNGTSGAEIGTFVAPGSGGVSDPEEITFGPDGNLYVASGDTNEILQYDGTTGSFIGVFASGNGLSSPRGLTFGPDGSLYVSNFGGGSVLRFNGTTGAFVDTVVSAGSGGLSLPRPLLFGPDANLYVGSFGGGDVLRYDGTTGAFIDVFASAGSGGLGGPTFLVFHDFAPVTTVPVPSTILLVVTALVMCAFFLRRRRRHPGSPPGAHERERDDAPPAGTNARTPRFDVPAKGHA
jgi:WD40 repeat protein